MVVLGSLGSRCRRPKRHRAADPSDIVAASQRPDADPTDRRPPVDEGVDLSTAHSTLWDEPREGSQDGPGNAWAELPKRAAHRNDAASELETKWRPIRERRLTLSSAVRSDSLRRAGQKQEIRQRLSPSGFPKAKAIPKGIATSSFDIYRYRSHPKGIATTSSDERTTIRRKPNTVNSETRHFPSFF